MDVQRFVHLSDIHIGQERGGTLPLHETIRTDLLKDCEKLRAAIGAATGIIVCGDAAYSGKRSEYLLAGSYLDRLAKAVGANRERGVFVIPGNHDIDRSTHNPPVRSFHKQLRLGTCTQAYAEIEELADKTPEDQNPLLIPLASYREFASQYACDFESARRPMWTKVLPVGAFFLRLLGLNSVLVSGELDAKEQMILGNTQYMFDTLPGHANIVLMHHPLEWLKDREVVEQFFNTHARVLIVGHEHKARIRTISDENDNELLMIDSGATNPPETGAEYKFAYNWLEFRAQTVAGENKLSVKVFPRVWVSGRTEFAPDGSRLNLGADHGKEYIITCPEFKSPAKNPDDKTPILVVEVAPKGESNAMANTDEEHFARLQFFFWRFLDWRQRLTVLAELKLLPGSLDRPIPQTMEKLALEGARSQNQLKPLWDAIMNFVPPNERAPNPF